MTRTSLAEPHLSVDPTHEGLLHSVYHRPDGWDFVLPGPNAPCGESSTWDDYHAVQWAAYLRRLVRGGPYLALFDGVQ